MKIKLNFFKLYSNKKYNLISVLFLLSFYFQNPSVYVGFALKPFMVFSFFVLIFLIIKKNIVIEFKKIDILFLIFSAYAGFVSFHSVDLISSFRLLLGMILILIVFNIFKSYFIVSKISIEQIEGSFYVASIIFVIVSLSLYYLGIHVLGGNFHANEGKFVFGVNIDRGMPRLVGPLIDPNIFSLYCCPFYFFLICKKNKKIFDFLALSITVLAIFLSFSRGGIIAILLTTCIAAIVLFFRVLLSKKIPLKLFFIYTIVLLLLLLIFYFFASSSNEYVDIIQKRLSSIGSGSGRFQIWSDLISLWSERPVFGFGLYNFLHYNTVMFGNSHYAHNTFLEILFDTGLVGLTLYMMFQAAIFYKLCKLVALNDRFYYLIFSYLAMVIMMNSLSLIINEVFFMLVGIISVISYKARNSRELL